MSYIPASVWVNQSGTLQPATIQLAVAGSETPVQLYIYQENTAIYPGVSLFPGISLYPEGSTL